MIRNYLSNNNKIITCELYGVEGGFPILINQGALGGYTLSDSMKEVAEYFNIRLIQINRPGFSGSEHDSDFKILKDWGKIIEPIILEMDIKKFGVLGISAGSIYAYSIANYYPEQVKGVWIIGGVPDIHLKGVLDCYSEDFKQKVENAKNLSINKLTEKLTIDIQKELEDINNKKNLILSSSTVKFDDYANLLAAQLQINCLPLAQADKLFVNDWGFSVADIHTGISIWHAEKDEEVPFAPVKKMIESLSNVELNIQEQNTHYPSERTMLQLFDSISKKSNLL